MIVALPALTLVSYLARRFVIAPSSPAHTWLTARLPEGVHVGDNALDLSSTFNAIDGVTAAVVCVTFGAMLGGVAAVFDRAMRGTGGSRAGTLIASVLVLGPAMMAGAAVSIALLHLEWAEATPSIPQDSEVNATIAWFDWHLADVVPVLDLPETLHWNLRFEFVDRWTGVLLLAGKLLLVGLLAGPIALVVRMTIDRARARRPTPPCSVQRDDSATCWRTWRRSSPSQRTPPRRRPKRRRACGRTRDRPSAVVGESLQRDRRSHPDATAAIQR